MRVPGICLMADELKGNAFMRDEKPNTGPDRFSPAARLRSFTHALNGLRCLLRSEPNARIHFICAIAVVIAGGWVGLSAADWRWIVLAIALVWFAEAINTAIEFVCDVVSPDYHASIEKAKDIAAGAVLICAVAAVIIACMTFGQYLLR
jgi:diacylglycerol kinase (ATP)